MPSCCTFEQHQRYLGKLANRFTFITHTHLSFSSPFNIELRLSAGDSLASPEDTKVSNTPVIALSAALGLAICVIIFMMIIVIRATRHQSQHRSAAVRKYVMNPSTAQRPRLIPSDELVANEAYGITAAVPEQLYAETSESGNATNTSVNTNEAPSRSAAVRKNEVDPSTAQHPRLIPSDELVANEAYGITAAVPEQLYAEAS